MAKKNLGNATAVSSMGSSDSFLIESGGSVRRVPLGSITVGLTYGENGEITAEAGGSGTAMTGYCQTAVEGTYGNANYVRAISVNVNSTYRDCPFIWMVQQREYNGAFLTLRLSTSSTAAAHTVRTFFYNGNMTASYVVRTEGEKDSTFDVYIKKSGAYDRIGLTLLGFDRKYMSGVTITYPDETADTLPDGAQQATQSATTLSVSDIATLSNGGGGEIQDTDTIILKTEDGLQGITIAQLREILRQ